MGERQTDCSVKLERCRFCDNLPNDGVPGKDEMLSGCCPKAVDLVDA